MFLKKSTIFHYKYMYLYIVNCIIKCVIHYLNIRTWEIRTKKAYFGPRCGLILCFPLIIENSKYFYLKDHHFLL